MFQLPWVSRELYNEKCKELAAERAQRQKLTEYITNGGVESAIAEAFPNPSSREAEDMLDQQTGELTPQAIRRIAQKAANERFRIGS